MIATKIIKRKKDLRFQTKNLHWKKLRESSFWTEHHLASYNILVQIIVFKYKTVLLKLEKAEISSNIFQDMFYYTLTIIYCISYYFPKPSARLLITSLVICKYYRISFVLWESIMGNYWFTVKQQLHRSGMCNIFKWQAKYEISKVAAGWINFWITLLVEA